MSPKKDNLVEPSVSIGQFEYRQDLKEKVVHFLWLTKGQPQNKSTIDQSQEEAEYPASDSQANAHSPA